MEKLGARLGKLSLKILEHFVGSTLGEGFVGELRKPTDRELAIESALENSEKRFVKEFSDKAFAANIFAQVSDESLGLISGAIEKFYDHPTDPDFQGVLNKIIAEGFPAIDVTHIASSVHLYIEILTEEFALADEKFRENVRALSDLQMVRILRHVEGILALRTSAQAEIAHDSIGFVPAAKAVTYVHRGKVEDDVISFLRSGGTGAIVGLHAPGGLGKTELAKQATDAVKDLYEGVLWVDVGENTASQVITAMLIQCGVKIAPAATDEMRKSELRAYLQSHKLLVIFDDVRKDALTGLHDFLPPKPCAALLTSRIQQMSGVRTFALDHLTVEQARELMKAILGKDKVSADLDGADKLAERLAWNPLALEIATRRILQSKVNKPITAFFNKVKQRFPELKMDGDERWDMRKIFDISYDDLTEEDQKRFRMLSVFHSTGFSPSAVAKIWKTNDIETSAILSRFMNLSLIMAVESDFERHRFHDLLDEYAWLLLVESGEIDGAKRLLMRWIVELFDKHYTDDPSTTPEIALELENLRLAAKWSLENKDGNTLALLATTPRNWLLNVFRINREWEFWLQSAVELGITDDGRRANVLQAIGDVQQFRKETDAAIESYNQALTLFKAVGDRLGEANVLQAIGDVQQFRKETDAAIESYNQALTLFKAVGAKLGEANVLNSLGTERLSQKDFIKALEYYKSAQAIYEQIGDKYSQSRNNLFSASAQMSLKEYDEATQVLMRSVNLAEEINVIFLRKAALESLVEISKETKSWEQTNDLLTKLIALHPEDIDLIHVRANVFYEQKDYEKALTAFRRASEITPDDSSLWNGVGNALESLKRYEETVDAYSRAIELTHNSAYLYRNRANVLLELNRLAEAEQDIAESAALEPDHPYTRARQGYLALAQGNFDAAVPYFEFAAENDESKSWKFGLGLSKFALGEMDEAQRVISTALPNAETEELEDTLNWLDRIVKLKPELKKNAQLLRDLLDIRE